MGIEENKIKKEILSFLNSFSGCCYRVNNGLIRGKYNMNETGSADIQGCIIYRKDIIPLQVEVKTKDGKLSLSQEVFKNKWESAGGLYCIATSVIDVINALARYKAWKNKYLKSKIGENPVTKKIEELPQKNQLPPIKWPF